MQTFSGILRYINQYKQLQIEIDEKTFNTLNKLDNHGDKSLAWIKNEDQEDDPDSPQTWNTRVKLVKYLTTDDELMRIENWENKKIKLKIQVKHYKSEDYGTGTNLVARKVWRVDA